MLLQLHARHPGAECHFVEDKLSTLEKVEPVPSLFCCMNGHCLASTMTPVPHAGQVGKVPELAAWKLYLVDWGYNTQAERSRASADPRIELVDLAGLSAIAR